MGAKKKVDWDKHKHLLGTMSDTKLGKILGVTGTAVYAARKRLGIPAWQPQKDNVAERGFWDTQPLGEMPDKMLALMLGVDVARVGRARTRRGIPPFRKPMVWTND